jgi:glycosyltransferase involved in cell wall biosynthesis
MRITFVRFSLLSRGGDKMVLTYASHLADQGHKVSIEANMIDTIFIVNPKIHIVPIGLRGQIGTMLSAFFKKRHAEVVIADIIPLAFALSFRNRKRVLYFAQDYNVTHYADVFMRFLVKILNHIGLTIFKIRTITVSEELSQMLSRQYKANIVRVIPNGVDVSQFYFEPSSDLKAEKKGKKSILILSRSDPRKGFEEARRVILNVKDSCAGLFEIWTVGESAEGKFPGTPHRDFGYVPESTLRAILSSADIFLYPSHSEGFGLMVVEAFACKCPVVTTKAIPYAVHEVNAMVSDIGDVDSLTDHVRRLLESSAPVQTITANGYAFAREHTLERAKWAFESALKDVFVKYVTS